MGFSTLTSHMTPKVVLVERVVEEEVRIPHFLQ